MLRLLKFLFTGSWHEHKYVPVEKHKCNTYRGYEGDLPVSIIHTYVSRCECGDISTTKVEI